MFANRCSIKVIKCNVSIILSVISIMFFCIAIILSLLEIPKTFSCYLVSSAFSNRKTLISLYVTNFALLTLELWYLQDMILLSWDVHLNPGPSQDTGQSISFSHWNLNSVCSNKFEKISLLTSFNTVHKYDVICLSETFLNSDTLFDDENLVIPGYNIFRSDHPLNTKRGGVCIFYKQSLPIKILDINYLNECIIFEVHTDNKLCIFMLSYRSPSQSREKFQEYLKISNLI